MATQKKAASPSKAPAKKAAAKKAAPAKKAPAKKKVVEFKADAKDGDGDGLVQDGTVHERKAASAPAPAPAKTSLWKRIFGRG